ncbi:hypothetical protein N7478_001388 [Penicillium angulare]|uniref:uncharacterized protein n=1 Tax=Penicillium angulare TaxID=116970 RepID=UPI00254149F8|nr:uncharacterized protein N7478_001388 [Penicillium angulare]KAJ5292137.1 hypothetical protein N7478_001388 [Penicillium angulare]
MPALPNVLLNDTMQIDPAKISSNKSPVLPPCPEPFLYHAPEPAAQKPELHFAMPREYRESLLEYAQSFDQLREVKRKVYKV